MTATFTRDADGTWINHATGTRLAKIGGRWVVETPINAAVGFVPLTERATFNDARRAGENIVVQARTVIGRAHDDAKREETVRLIASIDVADLATEDVRSYAGYAQFNLDDGDPDRARMWAREARRVADGLEAARAEAAAQQTAADAARGMWADEPEFAANLVAATRAKADDLHHRTATPPTGDHQYDNDSRMEAFRTAAYTHTAYSEARPVKSHTAAMLAGERALINEAHTEALNDPRQPSPAVEVRADPAVNDTRLREEEAQRSPNRVRYVTLAWRQALAEDAVRAAVGELMRYVVRSLMEEGHDYSTLHAADTAADVVRRIARERGIVL